jgi:uncharacterized C2H2 Zn-finger protein
MPIHQSTRTSIKCTLCGKEFKRKDYLTQHNKEIHHVANVNHYYSNNSNLAIHSIRPFQCKECGVKFKRKTLVERHVKTIHNRLNDSAATAQTVHKILKCQQCNMVFQKQINQKRHEKTVHCELPNLWKNIHQKR